MHTPSICGSEQATPVRLKWRTLSCHQIWRVLLKAARARWSEAKAKGFEPDVYVQLRLAPDQYPFVRQIQSTCDSAKFTCARLAGIA